MTPSDLSPACTVTHSLSISITTPVTIAPGSISRVLRLSSNSSANDSLINSTCLFRQPKLHLPTSRPSRVVFKLRCSWRLSLNQNPAFQVLYQQQVPLLFGALHRWTAQCCLCEWHP